MSALKTTFSSMAVAALLCFGPASASAADFTMIMNDYGTAGQMKGQTFAHLKNAIESSLGDRMEVQLYHNGTLYTEKTEVQALQLNAIQMIAPTPAGFTNIFPKLNVMELPYIFPEPAAVLEAFGDPLLNDLIFKELHDKNIKVVGLWMHGPREIASNKPYLTPADIAGVKIRVQPAPVYAATFKAFGATPLSMSWSEVQTSLEQGIIDGLESPYNSFASSKIYEAAPVFSEINYVLSFYLVAINNAWFEGLPADVQEKLNAAFDETNKWNWNEAEQFNEKSKEEMVADGASVYKPNAEQMKLWVDASRPVWDEIAKPLIGQEALDRLIEIHDKYE